MSKSQSTDLVAPKKGTQVANYQDLADKARAFAVNAHSEKTRQEYGRCWREFQDWCESNGTPSLPTNAGTLSAFITWYADGKAGAGKRGSYADGYKLSNSSINMMLSAIKYFHKIKGTPLKDELDNPALRQLLDGIRRTIGQSRSVRRVNPITSRELRDIIETMRPHVLRESRDAAVLAVGFGACRRRSEVVSLNYMERDPNDKDCWGYLAHDDKGVTIKLSKSKTNQAGGEEEYVIPRQHASLLCDAIVGWINLAKIKPGEPLFRSMHASAVGRSEKPQSGYPGVYWHVSTVGKGYWRAQGRLMPGGPIKHIGSYGDDKEAAYDAYCKATGETRQPAFDPQRLMLTRMTGKEVALVVKKRFGDLLRVRIGRKKLRDEDKAMIAARVATVSGHSMRVGFITTAAEAGVLPAHIQLASGHKSLGMIGLYTRANDKVKSSPLKTMGLNT